MVYSEQTYAHFRVYLGVIIGAIVARLGGCCPAGRSLCRCSWSGGRGGFIRWRRLQHGGLKKQNHEASVGPDGAQTKWSRVQNVNCCIIKKIKHSE